MNKFETIGKNLTKDQQKKIMGGDETRDGDGGEACNCNNNDDCAGNATKKTCYNGAAYSCTPGTKIGWCEV